MKKTDEQLIDEYKKAFLEANGREATVIKDRRRFLVNDSSRFTSGDMEMAIRVLKRRTEQRKQLTSPIVTVPIKSATVFFGGDSSVGILPSCFNVEMFFDPNGYTPSDLPDALKEIRGKIADLYESINGESGTIMFDFEIEAEGECERLSEEQS